MIIDVSDRFRLAASITTLPVSHLCSRRAPGKISVLHEGEACRAAGSLGLRSMAWESALMTA